MTQYDFTKKVIALIKPHLEESKDENIDLQVSFSELGLDWLAMTELVMELEEEFSIIISEQDAQDFINAKSIITYLQKISAA